MIGLQRTVKTGVFEVTHNNELTKIYIKNGDYIFATSNKKGERFGEFLLRSGIITPEQHLEVDKKIEKSDERIGKILVDLGYLKPNRLYQLVKQNVENIIIGLFDSAFDNFEFKERPLPTNETITLNNSAANLIYKGVKRISDSRFILDDFPALDSVLCISSDPADIFQDIAIEANDKKILSLVNGSNTIKDIFSAFPNSKSEIIKTIYAFICARIIVINRNGSAQEISPDELFKASDKEENNNFIEELNDLFDKYKTMGLYNLLGVQNDATDNEIRKAYLEKARRFHPDKHFHYKMKDVKGKLTKIFSEITLAYNILSSPVKRREYNKTVSKKPVKKVSNTATAEAFFSEGKSVIDDVSLHNIFDEGKTNISLHKLAKAENLIARAIYFDSSKYEYYYYYGLVLAELKKYKEAIRNFQKAIELNPSSSSSHAEIGHLFLNLGFNLRAKKAFDKALLITPSDKRAKEGRKILEGLNILKS
jgi:curved DNA-binding protein CbpA